MDKVILARITSDFQALVRRLQTYIDQLPESDEEQASALEEALEEMQNAIDDMEVVGD